MNRHARASTGRRRSLSITCCWTGLAAWAAAGILRGGGGAAWVGSPPLPSAPLVGKALASAVQEGLLRAAVATDPGNPRPLWKLGLWLAHRGSPEGRASLEASVATAEQRGMKMTAMAFPPEVGGIGGYMAALRAERDEFAAFCASSPALAHAPALQRGLPAALGELRELPFQEAWLVGWAAESARHFGPDPQSATYGETPFGAWRQVLDHPAAAAVVAPSAGSPSRATVLGSALGYQCLFFAAVGVQCVGYDLLPESLVARGAAAARRHGLATHLGEAFRVGDARFVPLAPAGGRPSLLWLNNEAWPTELRRKALHRAAAELPAGSVVVSYGPESGAPPRGLRLVDTLHVFTSWDPAEEIHILRKE